jgi:hypothetical protein
LLSPTTRRPTFSLYHDDDGAVFDLSTVLVSDAQIRANSTVLIEGAFSADNQLGNFGVESGVADALTFTVYGTEQT